MDERPRGLEALARATDVIGAPPEARDRVMQGVRRTIRRRRNVRRASVALCLPAAAVLAWWIAAPAEQAPFRIAEVDGDVRIEGDSVRDGMAVSGRLALPSNSHVRVSLESAELRAEGPASVELAEDGRVVVVEGSAEVDGRAVVEGPGCVASIDGRARVHAAEVQTQISIIAGTATATETSVACAFLDLEAPAAAAPVERAAREVPVERDPLADGTEPGAVAADGPPQRVERRRAPARPAPVVPAPAVTVEPAEPGAPMAPSELALEARAYREALARRRVDDEGALAAFRAMRTRWPAGVLAQEVDLQVVDALVRLGRRAEARAEATRFIRRHPQSPRVEEMRLIAEAQP